MEIKPEKWDESVIIIRKASAVSASAIPDHFMHDYGSMIRQDNEIIEKLPILIKPEIAKTKYYFPHPKGSVLLDPTRSEVPNRRIIKVVNRKPSIPDIKKEPGSEGAVSIIINLNNSRSSIIII